jgi:site-specific recombinase XerD
MVEELQRRNYSPSTIRGYILAVKQFAEYFGKPPDRLGATHVQRFQWYLLQERKLTPGTVEMRISALRFFFKKMLKRRDMHFDDLPFPKTPRKLPTVLSPEEVPSHDRWDDEPHASHDIDGAVCDRSTSDRTLTVEGERHRQQTHGGPYPTR